MSHFCQNAKPWGVAHRKLMEGLFVTPRSPNQVRFGEKEQKDAEQNLDLIKLTALDVLLAG
jgi:hypothetical protein